MTAPVKRHDGIPGKTLAEMYDKLASDYERLEQEFEKLRTDADLYRQWFNAVQDLSPQYLEQADYQAAARLLESLGLPTPSSVSAGALQAKP